MEEKGEVVVEVVVAEAEAVAEAEVERESGDGSRAAGRGGGNLAAPCRPGEGFLPVRSAWFGVSLRVRV